MTGKPTHSLVLASGSLYRSELLKRLGLDFQIKTPDIDETRLNKETPEGFVKRLAESKARAVADDYPEALIIGSDQIAVLGDRTIGKPGNHQAAIEQLNKLSGKTATFLTGLCLLNSATGNIQIDTIPFKVEFRKLTYDMIENYLAKERPYQCSGAFKSEGLGITLVKSLIGNDPTALVGLPLIRLTGMLETQGIRLP